MSIERRDGVRSPRTASFAALLAAAASWTSALASEDGAPRQSLDDAWWTGPILAASASTLPQGHFLIEPYVYDVMSYGRYDADGERREIEDAHTLGSLTYILYGLADRFTVGLIPTFVYVDGPNDFDSSGVRVGDLTLQAQYRLTQFREGGRTPTLSLVLQETLPTGKHDRLGDQPADGVGGGAASTTLALFSQYYFWAPSGRILRSRLNVAYTISDDAPVNDVSVYGTDAGFSGRARPGDSWSITLAGEYSVTRNWVLALDLLYQHNDRTNLSGFDNDPGVALREHSPTSWRFGLAPAIEYNFSSRVGVIVGARWFAAGRNTEASFTPVAAINMVY
jgi:hypothetical protein